jgi:hypothetical protein
MAESVSESDTESDHTNPVVWVSGYQVALAKLTLRVAWDALDRALASRLTHLRPEARAEWNSRVREYSAEMTDALNVPLDEMEYGGFSGENNTVNEWFQRLSELTTRFDGATLELNSAND